MELPKRKNIRLQDYDYSQNGVYFITVCVKAHEQILWENAFVGANIVRPQLSDIGRVVEKSIINISNIYDAVCVDKYVVMPNHVHMIIVIDSLNNGRTMCAPTMSRIIKQCKEYVTKQIKFSIWQKSFHDHIIRNEDEYQKIWQYIDENPLKWTEDTYFI